MTKKINHADLARVKLANPTMNLKLSVIKIKHALLNHSDYDHDAIIAKAFFLGYTSKAINNAIDEAYI